jgi:hypothetical protein
MQKPNRDSQWQIHPRTAIGDFDGEIEINIAGNSVSSSVLPMLDSHSLAAREKHSVEAVLIQTHQNATKLIIQQ